MRHLIVVAHPKKDSLTNSLAESFMKFSKAKGNDVDFLFLYDFKDEIGFFDFDKDFSNKDLFSNHRELIKKSDEIIFFFPLWNSSEPAILKSWYDNVFSAGFAFKYENSKLKKLLAGKNSKFFVTCDSNRVQVLKFFISLKCVWKYGRMNFSGIKVSNFRFFTRVIFSSEKKRQSWINSMKKYV